MFGRVLKLLLILMMRYPSWHMQDITSLAPFRFNDMLQNVKIANN